MVNPPWLLENGLQLTMQLRACQRTSFFHYFRTLLVELNGPNIWRAFTITHWEANSLLPQRYPLHPGEDVFIMGYPYGFHDALHNLPVFRNAMIASAFRVPFQGLPLFLTDGNLQPGMSGSPVISKPKNVWVDDQGNANICTGTVYYLFGVHSGTYSISQNPPGNPLFKYLWDWAWRGMLTSLKRLPHHSNRLILTKRSSQGRSAASAVISRTKRRSVSRLAPTKTSASPSLALRQETGLSGGARAVRAVAEPRHAARSAPPA
jgi:hypothetical protein